MLFTLRLRFYDVVMVMFNDHVSFGIIIRFLDCSIVFLFPQASTLRIRSWFGSHARVVALRRRGKCQQPSDSRYRFVFLFFKNIGPVLGAPNQEKLVLVAEIIVAIFVRLGDQQ